MKLLSVVVAFGLVSVAIAGTTISRKVYSQNTGQYKRSLSIESNSQENYVQVNSNAENDAANIIGHNIAKKVAKINAIVAKYTNRNGLLECQQSQQSAALKQMIMPMPNHQYLNMNENKINGLDAGIIKNIEMDTVANNLAVDYMFNKLIAEGNMKMPGGNNEPFNVKFTNGSGLVSIELNNSNQNIAVFQTEHAEMNFSRDQKMQLSIANAGSRYMQFLERSIENEMIKITNEGVVGCLKNEAQSAFNMPLGPNNGMQIVDKDTGLEVSMVNAQNWNEAESKESRVVKSVSVRQIESGNGMRVMVNIVLSRQPTWTSDILVNKQQRSANFKNVNFQANDIVATAVLENIVQINGDKQFNVAYVKVNFNGLKFNIADNQDLAMDVQQNLNKMMENNMAVVIKQQLIQQNQVCQSSQDECAKCANQMPSLAMRSTVVV
ncbi:uncharacterized protein LOC126847521 [Adelges cooleyi]|uniref:uncharacterized protein LOC126847521 n=1 Tax=Adelges cooleyi TaxID=133065 RepID=UPI002180131E|nr:uncharacterized protein LOC126847521 [Adelges cooleyi]